MSPSTVLSIAQAEFRFDITGIEDPVFGCVGADAVTTEISKMHVVVIALLAVHMHAHN